MTPVKFPGQTSVFAADQPPYLPLPAHMSAKTGRATFCWSLTWHERVTVLLSGRIWHQVLTFNEPLQPQKLMVTRPSL